MRLAADISIQSKVSVRQSFILHLTKFNYGFRATPTQSDLEVIMCPRRLADVFAGWHYVDIVSAIGHVHERSYILIIKAGSLSILIWISTGRIHVGITQPYEYTVVQFLWSNHADAYPPYGLRVQ